MTAKKNQLHKRESGAVQTPIAGSNPIFYIKIDQEKLKAAANEYLDASAVWAALLPLAKFKLSDIWLQWRVFAGIIKAVVSAVELAKAKLAADGKIDPISALQTAVDILDGAVVFGGVAGMLLEVVDGPFLKLVINLVLGDRHGVNWIAEAKANLGAV